MSLSGETDIVIIGYGMIGSVAALLAVRNRLKVAVIEIKRKDDLYIPKAGRIDAETMRIFDQLDLKQKIFETAHPLHKNTVKDKFGNLLFDLKMTTDEEYAAQYSIFQPDIHRIIHQEVESKGKGFIQIYENHRLEAFEQNKDRVRVIAKNIIDDSYFELNSRFIIACNGQESLIPAQCDLNYQYFDYSSFSLNVDTYCEEALELSNSVVTYCNTDYPVTCITDSAHHQRWEFKLDPDSMALPDISDRIRIILEKLIDKPYQLLSSYVHSYETRILDSWQRKRIFITGDAAHVIPPYLGVGLSAGIKDVHNLIWKLTLVCERKLTGKVLDYYQMEREANIRYLIRLNLYIQKLFNAYWLKFARFLLPVLPKFLINRNIRLDSGIKSGLLGKKSKLAGTVMPNFSFLIAQKQKSIDQLTDFQFKIISMDEDPVDLFNPDQIEYLAKAGFRFVKITDSEPRFNHRFSEIWFDKSLKYFNWSKRNKVKYLILRPDNIIFDAADSAKKIKKSVLKLKKMMPLRKHVSIV